MAIYEYIPEKDILYSSYRKISSTKRTSADAMIGHLCDLADQLRDTVLSLENLRTRELAKVFVRIDTTQASLFPKILSELRREWEAAPEGADKEALAQAIAEMEEDRGRAREEFNQVFFSTVKKIRDKCYVVSQCHMADCVIETLADKRKILDRLAKLSKETLLPLMKNLEGEIAQIDKDLSKKLDANIFDEALKLLPSTETVADLADLLEKNKRTPDQEEASKPETPAEAETLPDKGGAAKEAAEKTEEPEKLELITVKAVPAKTDDAGNASEKAAVKTTAGSMGISSLGSAIPEEAVLKLAYQAFQSTLTYISEADHVCKQISRRTKLREDLDALTKKYEEIQEQYNTVSSDIEDLDCLYRFLDQVGDYFTEVEKLDTTLTAYSTALYGAGKNAAVYDGIFLMLRRYMKKLELIWR